MIAHSISHLRSFLTEIDT